MGRRGLSPRPRIRGRGEHVPRTVRADGKAKCKCTGVMVPYSRDWEEVVKQGDFDAGVKAPEPDKTIGRAFIFNRKVRDETVKGCSVRLSSSRPAVGTAT